MMTLCFSLIFPIVKAFLASPHHIPHIQFYYQFHTSFPILSILHNILFVLTCYSLYFCRTLQQFFKFGILLRSFQFRVDKSNHQSNVSEPIWAFLTIGHVVIQQFFSEINSFDLFFEMTDAVRRINVAISLLYDTISDGPHFKADNQSNCSTNHQVLFDIFHQIQIITQIVSEQFLLFVQWCYIGKLVVMQSQSSESLKVVIRVRPLHQKQQQSIQHYEAYSFGKKRTQKGKLSQAALNFYAKYHHIHPKDAIKVNHNVLSVCDQQYKNTERKMRDFHFQQVFTPEYSNQQIFSQTIKEELGGIFEGVNCTMLAYGITGSGKTFSIFGHPKLERGISYLAFDHLFSMKAQHEKQGVKVTFKFTFIEIYNENVRDLLSEDGKRQVTIGEQKGVVTLSDALEVPINSVEQIATLISYGIAKRTSATTDSNLLSSRSHAILKLSVDCLHNGHSTHSKLFIIDLAGSEKLNMESNQRKNQGSNINRSLLTLGNCINALVQNSKKPNSAHVPYRDSKLTRLLKDSLGGAARTVMIACISSNPFTLDETITTLNYAERAQGIKKDILKNIKLTQSQCPRCRQMGNSISPKKASKKSEDPFEDINIWQSPNQNLQDSEMSSIFIDICQKLYQDIIENSRECQQIQRLRIDLQEPCEQFEQILKDNEQQRVHLKQILFNLLGQKNKIVIKEPQPKINSEKKKIKLNSALQKSMTKYLVQADQEEKENQAPVVKSSQKNKTDERTEIVIPHFQPTAPQHEYVSPFKKDDPVRQESNTQSRASFKRRRSKFQVVPRPSSVKKTSEEKALKQRQTFQQ